MTCPFLTHINQKSIYEKALVGAQNFLNCNKKYLVFLNLSTVNRF